MNERKRPNRTLVAVVLLAALQAAIATGASTVPDSRERSAVPVLPEFMEKQGEPVSFDVYEEGGRVHLLLGIHPGRGQSTQLFYTSTGDGGQNWKHPKELEVDPPPQNAVFTNPPQLAAWEGAVLAVWTSYGVGFKNRGLMAGAFSSDGGKHWKKTAPPAFWPEKIDQGFLDLAADTKGDFHLVWLDARGGHKSLQYNRFYTASETWSPPTTVDAKTCECCWNRLIPKEDGLFLLYRDIQPRDMALALWNPGGRGWKLKGRVGDFDWNFEGCPHVGGGLAAAVGGKLHATVWTGRESWPGIHYLRSLNRGEAWEQPKLLDARGRHSDIACNDQGTVVAAWDSLKASSVVLTRTSRDGGISWDAAVEISAPGTSGRYPRVLEVEGSFAIFWVEQTGTDPPRLMASWQSPRTSK